jgi:hypothetical protein
MSAEDGPGEARDGNARTSFSPRRPPDARVEVICPD